jgi:phage tail sheath protein FI
MAQLSSPGVSVTVIDESFYTPAAPGTTPLIIVASAQDKANSAGTGTAPGTLKANAGKVYLLTSQKDLSDTFGTPIFKTDASNNPVHAGEQNEYGLQTAYSFLGVSNRVFAVRADIDLAQLDASPDAPAGDPTNGTVWTDVATSTFGVFEWNAGTQKFVDKEPLVITSTAKITAGAPKGSIGSIGSYAVTVVAELMTLFYKNNAGIWVKVGGSEWLASFTGTPKIAIQSHTSVPQWKTANDNAITGSVWVKTTEPNAGAKWRIKKWNSSTASWVTVDAPVYDNGQSAVYGLDTVGGGANLGTDTVYIKANVEEKTAKIADFKLYGRRASGATILTSKVVATDLTSGTSVFRISETQPGTAAFKDPVAITVAVAGTSADAETLANAINAASYSSSNLTGLKYITAEVTSTNKLVIKHINGGDIKLADISGSTAVVPALFAADIAAGVMIQDPSGDSPATYFASLWSPFKITSGLYVISETAPTSIPDDGALWYNSVVDEVDMLVHNGKIWCGYRYLYASTDINGPIVSATAPTKQSDGTTNLVENDLWISTADIENYPLIYRRRNGKWVLVDSTDQTSEDGVLFRDTRWNTTGGTGDATIPELLTSNFVDFDCPDPALYPQGMLLWNLRRSGFNVKEYMQGYVDVNAENNRYNASFNPSGNKPTSGGSMTAYYANRWVSVAANQENGAGTFGRHAQRKVVIQKLQALANANQEIRDTESRIFNLMACPGYPELIGEMVNLNYDRGLTAFVVGDVPARLAADATSLLAWGTNQNGALEDNDTGLVSSDEYLGIFYPWGYTSDNIGNNVVVPPSHMMLRTIALSDNVSYPWFAPAGTRRGGITNATAVGYVDSLSGEFQSVALNTGQRDTLAGIKVNPLTFITGTGLVNYGQYTRAKNASSLDRINVARLVIYLRRQLSLLAKPYIFEPNDTITRNEIKQAAESLMLELVGQRALYDYIVVCDTSNNTPSRIDRSELYLDIAIEPVKAVEFIYIPLRLKNTGEIKGLG